MLRAVYAHRTFGILGCMVRFLRKFKQRGDWVNSALTVTRNKNNALVSSNQAYIVPLLMGFTKAD